ncbi:alpha/beta fold hydrolase [Candidatus Gracilibacteria bacterium]|nr:alpha/beta fold hydrolase [Candidatus Gracilibacteria bacterium]
MTSDPFFFPAGQTGCLLVHGFSGSPAEMRELGRSLATHDHTVLGLRLAGHVDDPLALHLTPWRDWLASARQGFVTLAERCERVVLVGFSLGGALAALLAYEMPVAGLVMLSTPASLQGDRRLVALPFVRQVLPWYYPYARANFATPAVRADILARAPVGTDLDDPSVQEHIRRNVKISIPAIDELRQCLAAARQILPALSAPALVMQGRLDTVAPPESAQTIYTRLGSTQKELVYWEDTGHQLLVDGPHRRAIYRRVADFVKSVGQLHGRGGTIEGETNPRGRHGAYSGLTPPALVGRSDRYRPHPIQRPRLSAAGLPKSRRAFCPLHQVGRATYLCPARFVDLSLPPALHSAPSICGCRGSPPTLGADKLPPRPGYPNTDRGVYRRLSGRRYCRLRAAEWGSFRYQF